MSRASRIIVADADAKNAGLLAFGFEREGMEPVLAHALGDVPRTAIAGDVDGVVISIEHGSQASEAMGALKAAGPMVARLPVIALCDPTARFEVLGAGVTDCLPRPHFVRDVVALARFHTLRKASTPTVWSGELGSFAGIFYLIRSLSSVGRTGVLTIVRSLRRAELRFYEGEITSAQVGSLHGMAALHQLLLWTEGKLDFRAESVVRRQQIPLAPQELIDDLGRFLRDFHELAPELGPGVVLEQDLRRVAECVDKIPKEVNPVLRLFDGSRLLSDIVEDSPFRVFETVKIAARLTKLGAIKPVVSSRLRGDHQALKVDDWLVGTTPAQGVSAVPQLVSGSESEPVGPRPGVPASPPPAGQAEAQAQDGGNAGSVASARQRKKAKKEKERERERETAPPVVARAPVAATATSSGRSTSSAGAASASVSGSIGDGVVQTPVAPTSEPVLDWGKLPGPAASVWDLPGYAPVVPSQVVAGEISSIARPQPDANLAIAGKVVAQDLSAAVQTVLREREPAGERAPNVLVDEPAAGSIRGTARERVDEVSAPVPQPIAVTPAQTTLPGPAPAPVPVVRPRARLTPMPVVAGPAPAPAAEPSGGVVAGVISGAVESRAPVVSTPELAEKIVVVDEALDPPRPPSVEIEIVAAPSDEDAYDPAAAEATLPNAAAVVEAAAPDPAATVPTLRNIADEEPSQPSARMPNILRAPSGIAPVVPVTEVNAPAAPPASLAPLEATATFVPEATPAPAAAPAPAPATAPEAVVVATPSAPTVQVSLPSEVTRPDAPVAVPAALRNTGPAPVVVVPPALLTVPAPAPHAPPSALGDEATHVAADAAHAAARALGFDAIDEEFFNQEHHFANAKEHHPESFDDLDHHHGAPAPSAPAKGSFWRRLIGGSPPPPTNNRRRRPTTVPPTTNRGGSGGGRGNGGKKR